MRPEFAFATADARSDLLRPVRRVAASFINVLMTKNYYGPRRGSVDFPVSQGSAFDDLRRGRKTKRTAAANGRNHRAEPEPITDQNAQSFIENAVITLQTWVQRPLDVLLREQQEKEEQSTRNHR